MATILYRTGSDGSFMAACMCCRTTAYAYPTSTHANQAKRHPDRTARTMLRVEHGNRDDLGLTHVYGPSRIDERDHMWVNMLVNSDAQKGTAACPNIPGIVLPY